MFKKISQVKNKLFPICCLKSSKKGFTLAEVLVTLGVVGVLAAILTPAVFKVTPSKSKVLFRKSYNILQQSISMIINDDKTYPADQVTGSPATQLGFNYVYDPSNSTTPTYYTNNKFCTFLTDSLNVVGTATCPAYNASTNGDFTTSDGIAWTINFPAGGSDAAPATQFPISSTNYATKIIVDVNGAANGPNCSTDSAAASYNFGSGSGTALTRCSFYSTCTDTADRYIFGIRYDGKIQVGSGGTTDVCANNILLAPTENRAKP